MPQLGSEQRAVRLNERRFAPPGLAHDELWGPVAKLLSHAIEGALRRRAVHPDAKGREGDEHEPAETSAGSLPKGVLHTGRPQSHAEQHGQPRVRLERAGLSLRHAQ